MSSPVSASEATRLLRGYLIQNLRAQLMLCDIAEAGFANEIRSLHTTREQRIDAISRRREIFLEREAASRQLMSVCEDYRAGSVLTNCLAGTGLPR
jgi:hypothetical protein